MRRSASKVEVLEGSMQRKHLVITCTFIMYNEEIPARTLIDSGATGIAFMDQDFFNHYQIPLHKLLEKGQVEVID